MLQAFVFQGLFVFFGEYISFSTLRRFSELLDLRVRLYENVLNKRNFCDIIKIEMEGYEMDGFKNLKFKGIFRDYQQRVLDN